MRAVPRPQTVEGLAALAAIAVILVAAVAIGLSPVRDRPLVAIGFLAVAVAAGGVLGAVVHARRARTRRVSQEHAGDAVGAWFSAPTLDGFPAEALAPLLPANNPPNLSRLQTAWVLATHGHDAVWLERHLGLPGNVARLLADTAHRRGASPMW
ncbi:hypothetical protein ABIA33_002209 [Streptacidiphilus sp. MAP12-16]|uniref:hypothetical protein n=1 Tax=Streptacidiphilus sp. MAP12-16 TaxID=3156300 RepID=UPI003511343C